MPEADADYELLLAFLDDPQIAAGLASEARNAVYQLHPLAPHAAARSISAVMKAGSS